MAKIKDVLFKLVTEDTTIASYIVADGKKRMYPMKAPDNAIFPHISYQRINVDNEGGKTLTTAPNAVGELYSINIWAPKLGPAPGYQFGSEMVEDIARAVKSLLNGYPYNKTPVQPREILGIDIQKIVLENETDGWEPDLEIYRISQQYRVFHNEG